MPKQLIRCFSVLFLCAACAGRPTYIDYDKMDYGLPKTPNETEYFDIFESDGTVYGISHKDTFFIDVNADNKLDKIIRGRFDTMTAHGYTFYEIYLNNGKQAAKFRTLEGADCFLEAYKFQLEPFIITKVLRPLGNESWEQPTQAKIEKYKIMNNKLEKISEKSSGVICDVRKLL